MKNIFGNKSAIPESPDYWMSYSDLMAGMLLVFILMLVAAMFENQNSIEAKERELREKEATLVMQEKRLEEKIQLNRSLRKQYDELHTDVSQVLGIREKILARLKERFENSNSQISFDDATGAVRLGSSVLFTEGSSKLLVQGQVTLDETMPDYFEALLGDPELRHHVAQIIIEGHTNSNYSGSQSARDGYLFNLRLSQDRAYEAMEYILGSPENQKYDPFNILAANGYSSARPIKLTDGTEDKARSRRIEIRFRLKDEEALNILKQKFETREKGE